MSIQKFRQQGHVKQFELKEFWEGMINRDGNS